MTGNSDIRSKVSAIFFAFVMVTSMVAVGVAGFAGSAAADSSTANIDTVGDTTTPVDIPGGNSDANQQVFGDTASTNLSIKSLTKPNDADVQHAVKIDISDLEEAGADISNAQVDLSNSAIVVDESSSDSATIDFANVEGSEVQLIIGYTGDATTAGDDAGVDIQLGLSGIDTTNVNTASGLTYTVRVDDTNSGDFGSGFTTDAISQTNSFSVASIEVVDLDTGESVTETSLESAIQEANGGDTLTGTNTIEIRLGSGTYSPGGQNTITNDDTRIIAVDGASPVIDNNNDPTLTINGNTVIEGVTFDGADNDGQDAIDVGEGADLSLTDVTFQNPGNIAQYLEVRDDSGTVDVQNVTFDGDGQNNLDGIVLTDQDGGADVTVEESTFTGLAAGIDASTDLSGSTGLNSFAASNNEFSNNNVHVEDDNDNSQVDLDVIFDNNEFDQYAVTLNTNDNIASANTEHAIYGDFDQAEDTADARNNIDTQGHTTLISEGDHTLDNTIDISADDVTIGTPSGAAVENVTVDVGTNAFNLPDNNDVSGLTVSDVTFEMEGNSLLVNKDSNADFYTDFSINNNRFTEIGGTTVVDLSTDNDDGLVSSTIAGNTFEPTGQSSSYTAVNLPNVTEDGSPATTEITNNVINGSDASVAVDIGDLVTGNNNEITLVISENTIRKTGAAAGLDLTGLDTSDSVDVRVQQNTITADAAGDATGILVSAGGEATVSVTNNEVADFDDTTTATAIDASGFNQNGLTIESNTLTNNAEQINFVDADPGQDPGTILSGNNFEGLVIAQDQESGAAVDNLDDSIFHGTVAAGLDAADDSGDFVEVYQGTYDENSLSFDAEGQTLAAASDASPTITGVDGVNAPIFVLDDSSDGGDGSDSDVIGSGVTIRGLTIDSSDLEAGTIDVDIDTNGDTVTVKDTVFTGTDDRTAIDAAEGGTVNVENNEISGYSVGILVNSEGTTTANIVENQILDNSLGVDVDDGTDDTNINFNDIVGNNVGLENDETDGGTEVVARGNWWGDTTGPSGAEFNGNGDEIAGGTDGQLTGTNTEPWLSESITNLPTDQYVVITDSRSPIATFGSSTTDEPNAEVLVAVLNDTVAGNTDQASTRLIADNSEPLRGIGQPGSGSGSATDPFEFNDVESDTAGDYTLTARDVDGNVPRGSAVQSFSGTPSDVDVTVERDTLLADDSTTVNATLQIVDANGNPVASQGDGITWLVDGASDAGVTRVTEETNTDANGQARLELTADTAGITLDIAGVYDNDGYSDSGTVETVNEQLNVAVSPETITAGNSTEVSVNVSSAASGDAVENADVDLSGAGVSQTLLTDADGTATATVNASSAGTIDVNVTADGFNDATAQITVEEGADETALARFDSGDDGTIDRDEAVSAIVAYNTDGTVGGEPVTRDQAVNVIIAYNTGASV